MNAVKELLMRIRSTYDGAGTTAAAKAVGTDLAAANTKASETAKKTGKDVQEAGQRGADGMNVMSAATAAMNGNFGGAATALVPLITKIKALGAALTTVSLVMAALTLAYTVFSKIAEYATKAAQAVAEFNAKSRADMIEAVTNAYNRQAIAMERVSKLRDIELERTLATNEANKEFELATARQAKLTELKGTTDETQRAEIEAKYTRVEQQITGNYTSKNEQAEYSRMKAREVELWEASEKKAQEILQKKAILRRTVNSAGDAEKAADDLDTQNAWGQNSGQIKAKQDEAKKARDDAEAIQKDIEKLEQDRVNLADEAKRNRGLQPSAKRRMEAAALGRQNEVSSLDISDSDRARSSQEAMRPAASALDAEMADLNASDQQTVVSALKYLKEEGQLTVDAIKQWTEYLRQIKTALRDQEARQRNQ